MEADRPGFSPAEVATITDRSVEIAQRIKDAGGDPQTVLVIGVTKAFPVDVCLLALEAGLVDLGENYAQELVAKSDELGCSTNTPGDTAPSGLITSPRWHFIGGLQRNKVKMLAGRVGLWQTVDRASLVDEIAKRCPGDDVLIQVNTTGEPQKSGCEPESASGLVERARSAGLEVKGLMTVGPTDAVTDPRPSFDQLRLLAERCEVRELSMGMSGDYEIAVAAGATMVRVGSALFGPRPPKR